MKNTLTDKLCRQHPFIYVGNGSHYFIGRHCFEECGEEIISIYEELIRFFIPIKDKDVYNFSERELKKIFDAVDQIKYVAELSDYKENEVIEAFVNSLNEEEAVSLQNQIENFVLMHTLYSRYECLYKEREES